MCKRNHLFLNGFDIDINCCSTRARQRLEQVQQTEEAAAEEALDRLDRKLEQTMRAVEASYEKNKERWVDTLFSLIVGVQP